MAQAIQNQVPSKMNHIEQLIIVRESLHLPEAGEERQRCGRASLVAVVNAQIYLTQSPDIVRATTSRGLLREKRSESFLASADPAPKHGGMLKVRNKFLFQLFRPLTFVVFLGIFDGITMLLATASSELR